MNKLLLLVAVFAGIQVCSSSRALAQDTPAEPANAATRSADRFVAQQLALLRKDIESSRKQLIAANLTLTETEATKFWPVYDQYGVGLMKITDTKIALIKEYADAYGFMNDEETDSLVSRWLDTDIAALQLHSKYLPIFRKVLDAKKTATFFQLEHRINMMIDLQLTSQLPLVQSQDSSPSSFTREVQ
jgi:hypothetical protein